MGRLKLEAIRMALRVTHKLLPKFIKYFKFLDLNLFIPYGIFNPTYTLSTELMLRNIRPKGRVADVGCGSGAIAIYIAKNFRVEEVIAYDVNPKALATSLINARLNGVDGKIRFVSSVEELREVGEVDYVVTNPPYLPLEPRDELDISWCGGEDLRSLKEVVRLGCEILRGGGVLALTTSSTAGIDRVMRYLRSLGLKPRVAAVARTPADTIYLVLALKIKWLTCYLLSSRI